MRGQLVILCGPQQVAHACKLVAAAPVGSRVTIAAPARTLDQNAKLWAMLTEVADAQPRGLRYTPEDWKALFMHSLGHEARFMAGLNGDPFPVGFRSSHLSKAQMGDLIEFVYAWGAENGVLWREDYVPPRLAGLA